MNYVLYFKDTEGVDSFNTYYNGVEWEHPLVQARRLVNSYHRSNPVELEFKKQKQGNKWRLNGQHHHPMFFATYGTWWLEEIE